MSRDAFLLLLKLLIDETHWAYGFSFRHRLKPELNNQERTAPAEASNSYDIIITLISHDHRFRSASILAGHTYIVFE
jgi:hypothetical protein